MSVPRAAARHIVDVENAEPGPLALSALLRDAPLHRAKLAQLRFRVDFKPGIAVVAAGGPIVVRPLKLDFLSRGDSPVEVTQALREGRMSACGQENDRHQSRQHATSNRLHLNTPKPPSIPRRLKRIRAFCQAGFGLSPGHAGKPYSVVDESSSAPCIGPVETPVRFLPTQLIPPHRRTRLMGQKLDLRGRKDGKTVGQTRRSNPQAGDVW